MITRHKAEEIFRKIMSCANANMIMAGSYRRGKEFLGDIDIIVLGSPKTLTGLDTIFNMQVISAGEHKMTIMVDGSIQIDFLFCTIDEYPTMLLYFTGSKEFNIRMRAVAKKKGFLLNEYGLWKGNKKVNVRSERDVFTTLEMTWLEPWQR
jgi:DNA polymerase (family 10)